MGFGFCRVAGITPNKWVYETSDVDLHDSVNYSTIPYTEEERQKFELAAKLASYRRRLHDFLYARKQLREMESQAQKTEL